MAPVSRPPMDDRENRNNEHNDLPSPVPFNEFAPENETGESPSNPLQRYEPFFAEYSITAEFNLFGQQNLPGIYCIPTSSDPHEWLGVLFLRQGMYQGAILRFSLKLSLDFPDTEVPPSLVFEFPVFHPDVDPETGELNVKRGFPTWKCGIHHVYQVLIYMQRCFFAIECTEPVMNAEAARLFNNDVEKYRDKAVDSVRRSREVVYDPPQSKDPNAIRFTPWDQSVHEPVRARILKSSKNPNFQASPGSTLSLSVSSVSTDSTPMQHGFGGACTGLSFFDDKTFVVMAKEKTRPTPVSSSEVWHFSDIVAAGDQHKTQKPAKSSSKSKLF